ncbi:MAG: hypothetical protein ABIR62_11595 [Dokdonella sp.]|uniref:hypothetical protein n=1 Tax=Dokdonella sp. TaxID=2291710 RepID=UPI00326764F7
MPKTLLDRVKRIEVESGAGEGQTLSNTQRVNNLGRANKKLRRANEILQGGFTYVSTWQGRFYPVSADRWVKA